MFVIDPEVLKAYSVMRDIQDVTLNKIGSLPAEKQLLAKVCHIST